MTTLTNASLALFKALADDSGNWNGTPLLDISKKEEGNLTQLKVEGLLKTERDEDNKRCVWVIFTDKGKQFATDNGIKIYN